MFIGIGHQAPGRPVSVGPCESFAEAAERIAGCETQLIVEFSVVFGWLAIWEGRGNRFELLRESAAAVVLESRREPAVPGHREKRVNP